MTSIAVVGAAGRMGHAIIRCAEQMDAVRVTAAVEQPGHPSVGTDAGLAAGTGRIGVDIMDDPADLATADVMVDFSFHAVVPQNVAQAAALGKATVLGTTGLTDEEGAAVEQAARQTAVLWSPNMSLGVNLLFALVEQAARLLGADYDAEIVETHHRYKRDAPSGTALALGERLAAGRNQDFKASADFGREGPSDGRPQGRIGVHAVRAGGVVGDHVVMFANDGERIELTHRAISRDALALGALRAAVWIKDQPPGLYTMQDLLGLT